MEAFFIEIEEKFVGIEEICNFEKLRRKSVISKNFKGIFEIFPLFKGLDLRTGCPIGRNKR